MTHSVVSPFRASSFHDVASFLTFHSVTSCQYHTDTLMCLPEDRFAGAYHKSWNNRLLELGPKGMQKCFGFGVVERHCAWKGGENKEVRIFNK